MRVVVVIWGMSAMMGGVGGRLGEVGRRGV